MASLANERRFHQKSLKKDKIFLNYCFSGLWDLTRTLLGPYSAFLFRISRPYSDLTRTLLGPYSGFCGRLFEYIFCEIFQNHLKTTKKLEKTQKHKKTSQNSWPQWKFEINLWKLTQKPKTPPKKRERIILRESKPKSKRRSANALMKRNGRKMEGLKTASQPQTIYSTVWLLINCLTQPWT